MSQFKRPQKKKKHQSSRGRAAHSQSTKRSKGKSSTLLQRPLTQGMGQIVGRYGPVYSVLVQEVPLFQEWDTDTLTHGVHASLTTLDVTPNRLGDLIGRKIECIARGKGKQAVVGDQVYFSFEQSDLAQGLILHVLPRKNALVRADALGRKAQTLAANLDRIWIVCAVEPIPKGGLIDRYLVAAHRQGIEAGVLFNKVDLIQDEEHEALINDVLAPYVDLGLPVLKVSAHTQDGLKPLYEALKNRRSVFVGHSGVGKTSLLNALIPGLDEAVKEVSTATGKGQHTTTTSTLYTLDETIEIIDSPGIRGFALWKLPAEELKNHFVEFLDYADQCYFHNCLHINEPKCAVLDAVDDDLIYYDRYDAYLRIYEDLKFEEKRF